MIFASRQMLRVRERLHWRLSIPVLSAVGPVIVVFGQPRVHINLQFINTLLNLFAQRHLLLPLEHHAIKTFADPVGSRQEKPTARRALSSWLSLGTAPRVNQRASNGSQRSRPRSSAPHQK
jgi:hypothetical protein